MKRDFASIARFVMENVGISEGGNLTFENTKDNFDFPVFYFPYPEEKISRITIGQSYQTDCSLYLQIFSFSNEKAMELAHKVKNAILTCQCLIPLYNEDGDITDDKQLIQIKEVRRIDDSVSEVYIRWSTVENYKEMSDGEIKNFFIGFTAGD